MQQLMDNREHNLSPERAPSSSSSLLSAIRQLPRQYLKVITRPTVPTLREEVGWARWSIVLVQLLILVVLTVTFNVLGHLIPAAALHTIASWRFGSFSPFGMLPAPFNGIVFILATFLIGLGTAYPFSKLSQGQGSFVEHAFILLLVTVPLVTLSGALLLIPASGALMIALAALVGALFLYRMVLHVLTIMAVHGLQAERATLIVLIIPMLIVIIGALILLAFVTEGWREISGGLLDGGVDFGGSRPKKRSQR